MGRDQGIFGDQSNFDSRFIPDYEHLKCVVDSIRNNFKYRVVMTQGVYDLIHEGHLRYLEKARSMGDVLIVGVDSDELTRQRKGPNRPIVGEVERMRLLTYMRPVDIVTLRHVSDRLEHLVETVCPDVLVMSATTSDVNDEHIAYLRQYCGEVVVLEPQAPPEKTSSTARIRDIMVKGLSEAQTHVAQVVSRTFEDLKSRV